MHEPPPNRRSIRLKNHDYASAGVYFVTICSYRRQNILGAVRSGEVVLNPLGRLVVDCWKEVPFRFKSFELDAFVLMPNHLHAVLAACKKSRAETSSAPTFRPALPRVIQAFKSLAWRAARTKLSCTQPLWQRGYFEHIVRSGRALLRIQQYIWENPEMWDFDRENPLRHEISRQALQSVGAELASAHRTFKFQCSLPPGS